MEDGVCGDVVCDGWRNGSCSYFCFSQCSQGGIDECCCVVVYWVVSGWCGDGSVEVFFLLGK